MVIEVYLSLAELLESIIKAFFSRQTTKATHLDCLLYFFPFLGDIDREGSLNSWMCELLTALSHSYYVYSEFEASLLYTLGLCALHYALCTAGLAGREKLTRPCHFLLASVQLINLYPPSRDQTVHQPLSCRLVDKTIHCERREVQSFEFHESLVFFIFIFFLLDILSTVVN